MERAGRHMDSETLASVEAQSRCERMLRCESTARTARKMYASSGRHPPGRDPISLILAVTLPPVARSFSVSSARSTALVSSAAISSSLAGFSDRMSTLVRASVGMELMLDPPSTMPKLYDERGLPLLG